MKKNAIATLFMAVFIFTFYIKNDAKVLTGTVPEINAPSYILMELSTGQVLLEKASNEIRYPASTTKIMTAILAIEMGKLDQKMTASKEAVADIGEGGSNIGIMAGEILTLEQLLKALLVSSANESANIIAENICAGSENPRKEFVKLMNKRARELGALNTNFVNPCGLHDPDHYTTASDMAKIARHAMTLPVFRDIVDTTSYYLPPTNKHDNWDNLIVTNKYLNPCYSGLYKPEKFKITGIKTGFTTPAGNCLVTSAVNQEGEELLAVVFGVAGNDLSNNVYACTNKLLEWGFSNYSKQQVISSGRLIKKVRFKGARGLTGLITGKSLELLLPVEKSQWQIDQKIHWTGDFKAPAKKGSKMGFIEYSINGVPVGKVDIITDRAVGLKLYLKAFNTFKNIVRTLFSTRFIPTISVVFVAFLVLRMSLRYFSRSIKTHRQQN